MPIYVSRGHFPLRYEVPKFLARGGHLCVAVLTITAVVVVLGLVCMYLYCIYYSSRYFLDFRSGQDFWLGDRQ